MVTEENVVQCTEKKSQYTELTHNMGTKAPLATEVPVAQHINRK